MRLPTRTSAPTDEETVTQIDATFEARVRDELAAVIESYRQLASDYSPATQTLWSRIGTSLAGGKLTRPRLVMLGYEAFNRHSPADTAEANPGIDRAVTLGCAFELLHASLLMHDDVIDRDFARRGRPTLSALYRDEALTAGESLADAEHAGHSAAIIAGDLLLAASIKLAMRAAEAHPQAAAIEHYFHLAIHNAGAGELEDLLFSLDRTPAKVQEVLRMEELKTASYSFRVPLHTGALLAGAEPQQAAALADIGSQLGVAYQLIDDVLGTFGDPSQTGKPVDSDLREGKSTILTAVAAATPGFTERFAIFRDQHADLPALRAALEATGAETFARQLAEELCVGATTASHGLRIPEHVSAELESFATLILNRGA